MELIIDNREQDLIKLLSGTCNFKVEQLDVGDVLFRNNNNTILIIERKTIDDLKASICDGRHREQKSRLLNCGIAINRIMYIIEGNINKSLTEKISGMDVSTLVGSIINTQLRDDIKVYKTLTLLETSEYIKRLYVKLQKEENTFFKSTKTPITDEQYSATLKKRKKDNLTPCVWFIVILSQIPQVNEKISAEIIKIYPTLIDLICSYEEKSTVEQKNMLTDITYPVGKDKQRRIGFKISERIHNYIYNKKC